MSPSGNNERRNHRSAANTHRKAHPLLHTPISEPAIADVRQEMGLTQRELAAFLGCSLRAVQSYEQGWRRQPDHLTRTAVLLLIAHRRGRSRRACRPCWQLTNCPERTRQHCLAFFSGEGELCWMLTGTYCRGRRQRSWRSKWQMCRLCKVLARLLKRKS